MFWQKKGGAETPAKPVAEKLPGPREIPEPVQKYLASQMKKDPDLVKLLRSVVRRSARGAKALDIRIFDDAEAAARKIAVKSYASLDEHPILTLYEGWFDQDSKQVELTEKRQVNYDVPILSEAEIRQRIEALSQPGATVFFYQARGPASGGPLGRGAAIIELNPKQADKGQKKYIVYTADVEGTEPVGKWQKLFASDKPREIARWVKESHQKRLY